ncbi:hypothetical protein ACOME3_003659 [Neoechinorhynchus agilis]
MENVPPYHNMSCPPSFSGQMSHNSEMDSYSSIISHHSKAQPRSVELRNDSCLSWPTATNTSDVQYNVQSLYLQPNQQSCTLASNGVLCSLNTLNPAMNQGKSREKAFGLRMFSTTVCQLVRLKGTTTYSEVADELVRIYCDPKNQEIFHGVDLKIPEKVADHKNIRRRVYDAINVLMALNVITKQRKEIHWLGFISNAEHECRVLMEDLSSIRTRIEAKSERLKKMITRCFVNQSRDRYVLKTDKAALLLPDTAILRKLGFTKGLTDGTLSEEDMRRYQRLVPPMFKDHIPLIARNECLSQVHRIRWFVANDKFVNPSSVDDPLRNQKRPASELRNYNLVTIKRKLLRI